MCLNMYLIYSMVNYGGTRSEYVIQTMRRTTIRIIILLKSLKIDNAIRWTVSMCKMSMTPFWKTMLNSKSFWKELSCNICIIVGTYLVHQFFFVIFVYLIFGWFLFLNLLKISQFVHLLQYYYLYGLLVV